MWTLGVGDEAWHAAVHGVGKSWTRLSDRTELKIIQWGKEQYCQQIVLGQLGKSMCKNEVVVLTHIM